MSVSYECFFLSGRGLCDGLITRLEESYRMCCVVVCVSRYLVNEEAIARVRPQYQKKKNMSRTRIIWARGSSVG